MHLLTLIGARPQFIKAAALSRAFRSAGIRETVVHSGQHYDKSMNEVFFKELNLPEPATNLGIGSGSHGMQTGEALIRLEQYLLTLPHLPDAILVYGDTNTTLAGALVAAKLQIPLAHVEAGLRSFNRAMPEEINRVVTDRLATWNFCPTESAVQHLAQEGISEQVFLVGDVMYDATELYAAQALSQKPLSSLTKLPEDGFYLATVHRAENTDDPQRLAQLFATFSQLDLPVLLPLHPRTRAKLPSDISLKNIEIHEPASYLEMLTLLQSCRKVLTDSGGLQKEAYWLKKQVLTLRQETEWTETLEGGWNVCTGTDTQRILAAVHAVPSHPPRSFGRIGEMSASQRIAEVLSGTKR